MKGKILRFLSYVLVAALASAVTLALVQPPAESQKLARLEELISQRFIGDVDPVALEDGAAAGMVAALGDRWSYYLSAKDYIAYKEQMENAYVGVGITIAVREDNRGFDIQKITPGGPAQEAGLLAGDILIRIEGTDTTGMTPSDAGDLVRGKENTQVSLTVLRDGVEKTFSVTRRSIQTPVATATLLDGGIGLVQIANFDSRCAEETLAAVSSLLSQGADKLIFDVRFNPGGYKDELVKVLDYLLPEGVLFRSEDYAGRVSEDPSKPDCLELPMAVLVNGDSYSAAEFFAAALREYEWATVVGQQTCGKGYFQTTLSLGDGSYVGLSVGKYFTPKGVSLAGVGITPDVVVEVEQETAAQIYSGLLPPESDPQIQAAIQALQK